MEIATTIIKLLVGLVVFVTGMSMMSSGLKKSAGHRIKTLFRKIKDNRLASIAIGAGTTAIIQSSSATSVMVVGFLGAGVMSFIQGFSVLVGAYIGTTVTGVLVSLSTFSFSTFLMAVAFIGFVLGFFRSPSLKAFGEILIGFGILFFGLEAMSAAFKQTDIRNALVQMLSAINFPLLLLLLGVILTAITQSSSATNGIVIVMVAANPALLSSGFYLVIGATVGAIMPTIIAALKSNVAAKRVTFAAVFTRSIFALIVTIVVWIVSTPLFDWLNTFPTEDVGLLLAIFTVIYNVAFAIVVLPFFRLMEKFSTKVIRDKDEERKRKALRYIDDNLLATPSLAAMQVKLEIENMFNLAKVNFFIGYHIMVDQDFSKSKELEEREDQIDYINNALSDYMIRLSANAELREERKIGSYYHVINDIERIGDHACNFLKSASKMKSEELAFSETAKAEFNEMEKIIEEMFNLSARVFALKKTADLEKLHALEARTDEMKTRLSDAHFNRIKANLCNTQLSPFHSTFLSELERVADHLTNIGYSIVNPTGDEETSYRGKGYSRQGRN